MSKESFCGLVIARRRHMQPVQGTTKPLDALVIAIGRDYPYSWKELQQLMLDSGYPMSRSKLMSLHKKAILVLVETRR